MPVCGLPPMFLKHMTNFRPVFLYDTAVVINASDFVSHIDDGISRNYGGENLAIHLKIKDILATFDKCGIVPHFIFSGGNENRGRSLDTKLFKRISAIRNAELSPGSVPPEKHKELSAGVDRVTVESLRYLRARFTVLPHSSLRCAASLAVRLDCPLIANSPDYFAVVSSMEIRNPTEAHSLRFVPLRYVNLQPIRHHVTQKYMLSAYEFLPHNSQIAAVSPKYRPLLIVLSGTDSMPKIRLPPKVYADCPVVESLHPKQRRFFALSHWFSKSGCDTETIIRELVEACPKALRSDFIHQLTDCAAEYIFHPLKDSYCVTKRLQIPDNFPSKDFDDRCEELKSMSLVNVPKQFVKEDLLNLLGGLRDSRTYRTDFTIGWPERLVLAYENGKILPSFMRALYSSGLRMISKSNDISVDVCRPLRLLHYRIMLGLERKIGGCTKLIGLKPHATEYVIRDGKAFAHILDVDPIFLSVGRDHVDRVLRGLFSVNFVTEPTVPVWTMGLISAIAYCRSHLPVSFEIASPEQCPVSLAIIGCAIAVAEEREDVADLLCQHFSMLADKLESENEVDAHKTTTFVEIFTVVQCVYYAFNSLVSLLESILPITHHSELFHFLPPWNIFPSGRLIHWLAVHLDSKPPATRQRVMSDDWLPRLCLTWPDLSATKIIRLDSIFTDVLKEASSLWIRQSYVKYYVLEGVV